MFWDWYCMKREAVQSSSSGMEREPTCSHLKSFSFSRHQSYTFSSVTKSFITLIPDTPWENHPHRIVIGWCEIILWQQFLKSHIWLIHYYQGWKCHNSISQIYSERSSQGLWVGRAWQLKINKSRAKFFIAERTKPVMTQKRVQIQIFNFTFRIRWTRWAFRKRIGTSGSAFQKWCGFRPAFPLQLTPILTSRVSRF